MQHHAAGEVPTALHTHQRPSCFAQVRFPGPGGRVHLFLPNLHSGTAAPSPPFFTYLDGGDSRQNDLCRATDELPLVVSVLPAQPLCVRRVHVYGTVEDRGPGQMCRVEVWVRDDYGFQTTP